MRTAEVPSLARTGDVSPEFEIIVPPFLVSGARTIKRFGVGLLRTPFIFEYFLGLDIVSETC